MMNRRKITLPALLKKKRDGEPITMLTCYDATFARILDGAGVDIMLVGDSLGMVVQGHADTLQVTLDDMIYHGRCVSRGLEQAHLTVDLPFMSYQISAQQALESAGRLVKEGCAQSVKLEGGERSAEAMNICRASRPASRASTISPTSPASSITPAMPDSALPRNSTRTTSRT